MSHHRVHVSVESMRTSNTYPSDTTRTCTHYRQRTAHGLPHDGLRWPVLGINWRISAQSHNTLKAARAPPAARYSPGILHISRVTACAISQIRLHENSQLKYTGKTHFEHRVRQKSGSEGAHESGEQQSRPGERHTHLSGMSCHRRWRARQCRCRT
jgi:hypothetical protein